MRFCRLKATNPSYVVRAPKCIQGQNPNSFFHTHHSIGILLEGYVKTQGLQELVTSPAALLPSHGSLSFRSSESSDIKNASFAHKASSYVVETRARVIMFDIAAFEADAALSRRSSSLLPHTTDHPHRSLGRQLSGLMSWPENFVKPTQHKHNSEGVRQQTNSLSARAMQLSFYGSMVDIRVPTRSLSSSLPRPSHSLSYPTIQSEQGRALVSVKSEGAATSRKEPKVREFTGNVTNLPAQSTERRRSYADDTSDESGGEEVIVRIDSPSTLSFRQAS